MTTEDLQSSLPLWKDAAFQPADVADRFLRVCERSVPDAAEQYTPHVFKLTAALFRTPPSEWRGGIGFTGAVASELSRMNAIFGRYGRDGERAFGAILSEIRLVGHCVENGLPLPALGLGEIGGPPRWAEYWLYMVLTREQRITLIGDLFEEFYTELVPKFGYGAARRWYIKQAVTSFGSVAVRNVWKFVRAQPVIKLVLDLLSRLLQ